MAMWVFYLVFLVLNQPAWISLVVKGETSCKRRRKQDTLSEQPTLLKQDHWRSNEDYTHLHDLSCPHRNVGKRRALAYTKDGALTVRYHGHVQENSIRAHLSRLQSHHGMNVSEEDILWHPELFIGYQLPGPLATETLSYLQSLPDVLSISRSRRFVATSQSSSFPVPWGLDRLDQQHLPLDGRYETIYNGTGVNVFVVDSGIDTTHVEFVPDKSSAPISSSSSNSYSRHTSSTYTRQVRNVFDRYKEDSGEEPGVNNDYVGHGTHVSGTIGGKNVGVAKGVNIYGVRVLSQYGEGSDFDIMSGLSFVYKWHLAQQKLLKNSATTKTSASDTTSDSTTTFPSGTTTSSRVLTVISMSLGGVCTDYSDCQTDMLVQAVDVLSDAGIVVVASAGNSDCDACLQTPAFAPRAITVGASTQDDKAALFSDFGKCIDIYAPGVNITSACASRICQGTRDEYVAESGTSMSAPHVSGVVALLLQAHPNATSDEIADLLTCTAAPMVLTILQDDVLTSTRNLLLQIPLANDTTTRHTHQTCDLGAPCVNSCSGRGLCQENHCLCESLSWGADCSVTSKGNQCDHGYQFIEYNLFDGGGDTWQSAELRISLVTPQGGLETVVTTSMCGGFLQVGGICLKMEETYQMEVRFPTYIDSSMMYSGGGATSPTQALQNQLTAEVGWSLCGQKGGIPASVQFRVLPSTRRFKSRPHQVCEVICNRPFLDIGLVSKTVVDPFLGLELGEGWDGGYYHLVDTVSGLIFAGGTLLEAQPGEMIHRICLPDQLFTHPPPHNHPKISARFVAIFHGNSDSLVATSASQLTSRWSLCNLHRPLTTDFVFFEIEGNNVSLCTSEIATIVADLPYALMSKRRRTEQLPQQLQQQPQQQPQPRQQLQLQQQNSLSIQPLSIQPSVWAEPMNPLRPLRMGVFTTNTDSGDGKEGMVSKWVGTGYALTSRMYEGTPLEEHDILIANGTMPMGVAAAQFLHPLGNWQDWYVSIGDTTVWRQGRRRHRRGRRLDGMKEQRVLSSSVMAHNDSALTLVPEPRSFWLTCGQEGDQWDGYYKFHRTNESIAGCERSCAMLNATDATVDFDKDLALALFTTPDVTASLTLARRLDRRNFLCMSNHTASHTRKCYRAMLGIGQNLVRPSWQLCNASDIPTASVVEFCVQDWNDCTATVTETVQCSQDSPVVQVTKLLLTEKDPPSSNPLSDTSLDTPSSSSPSSSSSLSASTSASSSSSSSASLSSSTSSITTHFDVYGMNIVLVDPLASGTVGYSLYLVPVSFQSLISNLLDKVAGGNVVASSSSPPSSTSSTSAAAPWSTFTTTTFTTDTNTTDDNSSPGTSYYYGSATDDYNQQAVASKEYPFISSESLPVGTQTKAMGLCVIDGCYLLDVISGIDPYTTNNPSDTAAFVVCGAVGAAGTKGVLHVAKGRCEVMASVLLCQVTALSEPLRHLLWTIYAVGALFVGILTLCLVQYCRRKRITDVGEEYLLLLPPSLPTLDGLGEESEMNEETQHSAGGVGTVYRMDGTGGRLGGRGRGRGRGRSIGRGLPGGGGEGGSSSGTSSGGSSWGINWGGSGGSSVISSFGNVIGGSGLGGGTPSIRGRRVAPTISATDTPTSLPFSSSSPSDIEMVEGGVGVVAITYNPLGPNSTPLGISNPSPRPQTTSNETFL